MMTSEKYYSPEQKLIQAALTMDARAPSASHVLRKTIVARMVELSGCLFLHHRQELEVMKYISFRVPRPGDWRCRRSPAPPAPQPSR